MSSSLQTASARVQVKVIGGDAARVGHPARGLVDEEEERRLRDLDVWRLGMVEASRAVLSRTAATVDWSTDDEFSHAALIKIMERVARYGARRADFHMGDGSGGGGAVVSIP